MNLFAMVFWGNTLHQWVLAVVLSLILFFLFRLLKNFFIRRALIKEEKDASQIGHFASNLLTLTKDWFLASAAVFLGLFFLTVSPGFQQSLNLIFLTITLLQVGFWGTVLINFWVSYRIRQELARNNNNAISLNALGLVLRIILWSLLVLLILDNLPGIEVSTLITSLGVGGIAVALAVQNILGDLFASLSITLDKPFVIGDFINVGDMAGSVEHVGLKSTRVRSLSGEQLVFSNSDLLSSRIRNYKRMERRRIAFTISVSYDTPADKLEGIPKLLREIICQHEQVTFDRAHFKEMGSFALNFEVVYFVENPDYMTYMDIQQAINLEIIRRFGDNGIEFAFPTQTIYVKQAQ